jgi:hypothetical protein
MLLIDSNIIIYYLNGERKASEFLKQHRNSLAISIVTYSEVLSTKMNETAFIELCKILHENFVILEIDLAIAEIAAKLRQKHKIKMPDALIAATATYYQLAIVTRNVKDFKNFPIQIINPIDDDYL